MPSETLKPLYPNEDGVELPRYSTRCTTMSNLDFYPNMNIFTQFGDLSPSQMLTLFTQFRKWPEFSESTFVASLENTLLKMEAAPDENICVREEDDLPNEEAALDDVKETKSSTAKPITKSNRNSATSN